MQGGIILRYLTIRATAAQGEFPNEATLRRLVKEGRCPGFYQKTRFYVDTTILRQQLDQRCSQGASEEV